MEGQRKAKSSDSEAQSRPRLPTVSDRASRPTAPWAGTPGLRVADIVSVRSAFKSHLDRLGKNWDVRTSTGQRFNIKLQGHWAKESGQEEESVELITRRFNCSMEEQYWVVWNMAWPQMWGSKSKNSHMYYSYNNWGADGEEIAREMFAHVTDEVLGFDVVPDGQLISFDTRQYADWFAPYLCTQREFLWRYTQRLRGLRTFAWAKPHIMYDANRMLFTKLVAVICLAAHSRAAVVNSPFTNFVKLSVVNDARETPAQIECRLAPTRPVCEGLGICHEDTCHCPPGGSHGCMCL